MSTLKSKGFAWERIIDVLVPIASILILCFCVISRMLLKNVALNRDEGTYMYLGKQAMAGKIPYIDFYEMKPPVLFYSFGILGKLFGFSENGTRISALVLVLISGVFLYLIARKYTQMSYAWIVPAVYAFFSLNLYTLGFTLEVEHLVNALLLGSFYLWLSAIKSRKMLMAVASGFVFGLAVMTKQTSFLFVLVFPLMVWAEVKSMKEAIALLVRLVVGGLTVLAIISLLFMLQGNWKEAIFWLVTYPGNYLGGTNGFGLQNFSYFGGTIFRFQGLALGITGLTILLFFFKSVQKKYIWLLAYLLLAGLSLTPGMRFYGQYWQLLWPPIALIVAIIPQLFSNTYVKILPLLLLMAVSVDVLRKSDYYFHAQDIPDLKALYHQNPFEAVKKLSLYARKQMGPNDNFFVIGSEPQAYIYSKKNTNSRHIFMSMLANKAEIFRTFTSEVVSTINNDQPDYILFNLFPFSWSFTEDEDDSIYTETYRAVSGKYEALACYNMDQNAYAYRVNGDAIDFSKPNQIILLKRK